MTDPSIVAQGYDAVYDAMPRSPTLLRLWKQLVASPAHPEEQRSGAASRTAPAPSPARSSPPTSSASSPLAIEEKACPESGGLGFGEDTKEPALSGRLGLGRTRRVALRSFDDSVRLYEVRG